MPYITEEIYQKIEAGESIMTSPWPETEKEKIFSEEEISEVEFIIKLIQEIRKIKTELNIPVKSLISIGVKSSENEFEKIKKYLPNLNLMCKVGGINKIDKKPEHSSLTIIEGVEIYVLLEGLIDFEKEKLRLQKEIEKINEGIKHLEEKLNDSKFLKFAPEKEVERLKTIFDENNTKLSRLQKYIEEISK
jgi:valyl-tRNA synthetase